MVPALHRLEFDGLAAGPDRLVPLAQAPQGRADFEVDRGHRRPRRQGGPVEAHRLRRLPLPQGLAQGVVEPEVLRAPLLRRPQQRLGLPVLLPQLLRQQRHQRGRRPALGCRSGQPLLRLSCQAPQRLVVLPQRRIAEAVAPLRVRVGAPSQAQQPCHPRPVLERVGHIGPMVQGHHELRPQLGGTDPGGHGPLFPPDVQARVLEGARVGVGHAPVVEAAGLDRRGQPDPLQRGRQPQVRVRPDQPPPQVVRAGLVQAAPGLRENGLRLGPAALLPQVRDLGERRLDRLPRPPLPLGLLSLQPQPAADRDDEKGQKRRQQPRRRRLAPAPAPQPPSPALEAGPGSAAPL